MELTKLGPVLPASYPCVTFRMVGKQEVKVFDPRNHVGKLGHTNIPLLVDMAKWFVDIHCRPLLRLDGYKPEDRSYVGHQVISSDVDFFYSDHPLVKDIYPIPEDMGWNHNNR